MYQVATQYYIGTDGPDLPARTCEICGAETEAAHVGPCPSGNGWNHHRHVVCPLCLRASHALALKYGGQVAISWLN